PPQVQSLAPPPVVLPPGPGLPLGGPNYSLGPDFPNPQQMVSDAYKEASDLVNAAKQKQPVTGWHRIPKALQKGAYYLSLLDQENARNARIQQQARRAAEASVKREAAKEILDIKKQELGKLLSQKDQADLITKFIKGQPEEREGLMRKFPNLKHYEDIP